MRIFMHGPVEDSTNVSGREVDEKGRSAFISQVIAFARCGGLGEETSMQLQLALIEHEVDNTLIHQRAADGYVNATAMCKAVGKLFNDYSRLGSTQAFLNELSSVTGIPVTGLVVINQGGVPELQGTWVHPQVAISLAQWCSAKFAVVVSQWVFEWMTGAVKARMPYHVQRYMANRSGIPPQYFSMLNELTFGLIAPLEEEGYRLPDSMVPDISTGRMFSDWLRAQGIDPNTMPTYNHTYADGRTVPARLYPNRYLADFREFFHNTWLPNKAVGYFMKRDPKALPYLPKLLPPPNPESQSESKSA